MKGLIPMLQIHDLTITLNENLHKILEHFTFTLNPGDRAVIIGEEGNGKSTLLKLIADPMLVDSYADYTGTILKGNGRLGYLAQELTEKEKAKTVYEYLLDSGAYDFLDARETAAIAAELRLSPEQLYSDQMVGTLSGGEKVKLQLSRILLCQPDILLLDEPTNDIDIDTLEWLEQFLLSCRLPVLYVSHDETLIERTANRIIHLEQVRKKTVCRHTIASVPYRDYIDARSRALSHQEQVARKEHAEHKKQMARWQQIYQQVDHDQGAISRQDPHGGRLLKKKMKAVKSTGKRLEREAEDMAQLPDLEEALFLSFPPVSLPSSKQILDFSLPVLETGGRVLSREIALSVSGNPHLAIIGKNGAGKTTLLRQIAAVLLNRIDLKVAYMPQNYQDSLTLQKTPVEFLASGGTRDEITRARNFLGSVRFTRDEMSHTAGELSGGQKAKLFFLKMVLDQNDVLILDEPTRNFSPLSNPVIRQILKEYGGAIISVTHDRKYLDEVCNQVYELKPEGLLRLR